MQVAAKFPVLPKSYKGAYPFKICTTSFIYPAGYVENIRRLGPFLDEIELVLFESARQNLPKQDEIKEIRGLAEAFDLTFNVHLPLDIHMGSPERSKRHFALETIGHIVELTAPLSPSSYTLHLPYGETGIDPEKIKTWQDHAYQSMESLLATGIAPESILIENLDYPFEWTEKILNDLHLWVCVDIGHLLVHGHDVKTAFNRYGPRISVIHLHGVENSRDHLSLDRLTPEKMEMILRILMQFRGVVSLEVFSFDRLKSSLSFLEKCWHRGHSSI